MEGGVVGQEFQVEEAPKHKEEAEFCRRKRWMFLDVL